MEENKNSLIAINKSRSLKIKNSIKKFGNITKYSVLTAAFGISTVVAISTVPILAVPTIAGLAYNSQKLLNTTMYKSYKDLAFVTKKVNNSTIKIFQDWTRNDITEKIKNYTDIEKAGFMQLQAIIGLSKFRREDTKGNLFNYFTTSHSITRKTLKRLEELGYIENYNEKYKKDTRLIIPKLAFGNIKDIKEKVKMYNINFNRTDKEIHITDPKLQKAFPMVFGKRGLIIKHKYEIVPDGKGGLTYRIKNDNLIDNNIIKDKDENNKFRTNLTDKVLTYEKQKEFSEEITKIDETNIKKEKEDKQL